MPNYRRTFIPGGCWFFTVNLQNRYRRLLTENIETLRDAVRKTKSRFPFRIDTMVVLPDHIHTVWTLPYVDSDYSLRWRMIKMRFSKSIPNNEWRSKSRRVRGERGIWQRRYWEHAIRDQEDYNRHVEYCYFNPVKHGLVEHASEWKYSSFCRDVRAGLVPLEWGGASEDGGKDNDFEFGERR